MKKQGLLILIFWVLALSACQPSEPVSGLPPEVATLTRPAVSPSGKYRLVLVEGAKDGVKALSFQVQDAASSQPVFSAADLFSTRTKTYFLWDAQDRVWVSAGTQGTFFWQKEGDAWVRYDFASGAAALPAFLKQAAPVQH